jgi:hypothetical protein
MPSDPISTQQHLLNYDPSTITGALIWGVAAGILTSVLLLLCARLIQQVLLPWYGDLVYKGVDLRGKWIAQRNSSSGVTYHFTLLLKQTAHNVKGSMTVAKINPNSAQTGDRPGDYVQGFAVLGTTWEGFVTLNMTSDDRRSLSFSTSLLQVRSRGQKLVGHMVYRSSTVDQVESHEIIWARS